jgi:branched-chain amino acid transport system substrate-binding protein
VTGPPSPRRALRRGLATVVLIAVTASCAPEEPAGGPGDTVRVGLLFPRTGPFAGIGEDQIDGFTLYTDEAGSALAGFAVELVHGDTANDPAVATEVVERMVKRDQVDIIVGVISSAVASAIGHPVREMGVPLVLTAAAADELTKQEGATNIFRVTGAASQVMMPLGPYVCEELGYETAAIIALDYSLGWETTGGFARTYEEAGCDVTQELYSPLNTEDWAPVVQEIDRGVDVIVQTTTGPDSVRFLQAVRDFGLQDVPMIAYGAATDAATLTDETQRALAEGLQSSLYYSEALDTDANKRFQEGFRAAYERAPGVAAESGYVAAMVLEAALAKVDEPTFSSLAAALADAEVDDAPRGSVTFDEYGQVRLTVYLLEMREVDGEWQNDAVDVIAEDVSQFWHYEPEEYLGLPSYAELKGTWEAD